MANNYTTTSLEALKYICSVINKTVDLPSTVISDTSVATNTTYSSVMLNKVFNTLEDELKNYTDAAIAGLNRLTKEIINDKALVVKDNVLYLYKAADDPSNDYMQMMLINGVAVELGSTQVDMSDYYNKADSDNRFAAKLDLDTLTTSFNDLKTAHGTHVADSVAHLTQEERDKMLTTDDIATSIDDTSTNDKVVGAKAVADIIPFKFGIDDNGNYGYYKVGADSVTPFKSAKYIGGYAFKQTVTIPTKGDYIVTAISYSSEGNAKARSYTQLKTVSGGTFEQLTDTAYNSYSVRAYKVTTNSDNAVCTFGAETNTTVTKI